MSPAARPRSGARWLVVALVAALAILGWEVSAAGAVQHLDNRVRGWILGHRVNPIWDVLRVVTNLGNALVMVPALLLVSWVLSRLAATTEPLVRAAAAAILLSMGVLGLKALLGRPAPNGDPASFLSGAWPSGHTATATVVFGLLGLLLTEYLPPRSAARGLLPILYAVPPLVAGGLVYCDFHWLSDVVGGFLLGVLVLLAVQVLARRLLRPGPPLPMARPTAAQNRW